MVLLLLIACNTSTEKKREVDTPHEGQSNGVIWAGKEDEHISISEDWTNEYSYTILKHSVEVMRDTPSGISDSLHICGMMCYEYPVFLAEENDLAYAVKSSINSYFENACDEFFSSEDANTFLSETQGHSAYCTGDYHSQYANQIEIGRICYDKKAEIYSVYQISHWFIGGINYFENRGEVFSLKTGERIFIDYFIDTDFNEFRTIMFDFLVQGRKENGMVSFSREELEQWGILSNWNDIEFYYEDAKLYIFLPAFVTSETSHIIVWSVEKKVPIQFLQG